MGQSIHSSGTLSPDHQPAAGWRESLPDRTSISGVLLTADPVDGNRAVMTGSFVSGPGWGLSSIETGGHAFTLERRPGLWLRCRYEGPSELKRHARKLLKLGDRLEKEHGCPQNIAWAVAAGKLHLLSSRPIATMVGHNPFTGEYNDSLTGDYLWSNANLGEAFIDVLTPFTYSMALLGAYDLLPGHRLSGNIAGRFYFNLTMFVSMYGALGLKDQVLRMTEPSIGRLPEDLEIPAIPFSLGYTLTHIIPNAVRTELKQARYRKNLDEFLKATPRWCESMQQRIRQADTGDELVTLWHQELEPYQVDALWATKAAGSLYVDVEPRLRGKLVRLVGETNASALLSSTSSRSEMLESIGPMAGISRVALGEMSREEYWVRYGHRGPHEMELSIPRPIEDPDWLDRQLDEFRKSSRGVGDLLEKRRAGFEAAWQRLQGRYPRKAPSLRKKIDALEEAARRRESIRSEGVRVLGAARAFALRAGELTGLGDDVFFLAIDELLDVLSGQDAAVDHIPARRETHARYRALPPLPGLVRGCFDPFQWAADPNRRSDLYDARAGAPKTPLQAGTVTGSAGSPGRVEGLVRRLDAPEEGDRLKDGEILVTAQTNVGWTLLFPRTAAVVTDVGAPLSHAAIVARELGIPAVVGCGNATARLRTGDRVRVDGGRGIVEIVNNLS